MFMFFMFLTLHIGLLLYIRAIAHAFLHELQNFKIAFNCLILINTNLGSINAVFSVVLLAVIHY